MTRCCHGMRNPTKEALLTKLRALHFTLPDEPQIHGPQWNWRVVDVNGRDAVPPIWSTVPMSEAATSATLYAELGEDGYEVKRLTALTG